MSDYYFEGWVAAKADKRLADCPHPVGSQKASDWFDGYEEYVSNEGSDEHY
jgi:hypothetical protein